MTRALRIVNVGLLLLLVGCSSLAPLLSTPTPVPASTATATPQATPTPTAPVVDQSRLLRIWLPPQFDPNAETPSAQLLKQRLLEFENEHPGLEIEVRIKTTTDITGALSITSNAAPSAMPDLIALSYADMQMAASAGFLHPLEGLTDILQEPDWYAFARELGHFQNTEYGLPFASDALLMVYRPAVFDDPLSSWDFIINSGNQIVFPASDLQASFPLALYLSLKKESSIDEETLTRVLTLYQQALTTETISPTIRDLQTAEQSLQIFRDGGADLAVGWASSDIGAQSGEYLPLLGLDNMNYSLGTGWVWSLAGSGAENEPLAAELASYLVESDFMSAWTQASGYLPTRPQALGSWTNETLRVSLDEILQSTHPVPVDDGIRILRPLLQEALIRIFNGEQPEVVARSVMESVK
ncbi:MAG: extracellular solute-binding protein [Anaerolineales bacterium]|nr:extracellular solute-binding protein [Anaerolineales bacterium]